MREERRDFERTDRGVMKEKEERDKKRESVTGWRKEFGWRRGKTDGRRERM